MITIITRWDAAQLDPEVEWQMWRQLIGFFNVHKVFAVPRIESMEGKGKLRQFDSMMEALLSLPQDTARCFLEPKGYNALSALPTGDIALIIGNTNQHNLEHARVEETYVIQGESMTTHLYGTDAAAIAMAVRYGQ